MCVECAKKVLDILSEMEKGGEFDGLNDDERDTQRQIMGIRLRADIKCFGEIKKGRSYWNAMSPRYKANKDISKKI